MSASEPAPFLLEGSAKAMVLSFNSGKEDN